MPILAVLLIIIQIAFVIHVVRTGREVFWIYIIIFVPAIGCLVYFITQVLPEIGQNRTLRRASNTLIKAIDPQRELRKRKEELKFSDTLDNRFRLANECMEANLTEDAVSLYESCLKGSHEGDPHIMLKLAQAYFQGGNSDKTKLTLEELIKLNPDFKSADGHLLYARSLEELGLLDDAIKEYGILAQSYPGEEARVRYGILLKKQGKTEKAKAVFDEILLRAKRAPKYYRRKEKEWIQIAREHRTLT